MSKIRDVLLRLRDKVDEELKLCEPYPYMAKTHYDRQRGREDALEEFRDWLDDEIELNE